MLGYFFLLPLWSVVSAAGLVGITNFEMEWPDSCASACTTCLSTLYLTCSQARNGAVSTSDKCRASNTQYLSSLSWCWAVRCENVSISDETFQKAWEIAIPGVSLSYHDALALGMPQNYLDASTEWLNSSMLPLDALYEPTYMTLLQFVGLETWHARFGLILICLPWLLVVAGLVHNFFENNEIATRYFPAEWRWWLRKYVLTPALFSEKCNVPVSLAPNVPIDYVPPRIVALTIFVYYALNIVFCSVNYTAFEGNQWYDSKSAQILAYVGNRTGVLAFVNLPIVVLFASRNNILQWLTGWSYATFQLFHRHAAIIAVLEALVHSVIYTVVYLRAPNSAEAYAEEAAEPYYYWGIVATTAICLIPPLSILVLRQWSYEVFVFFHYALSIVTLVGCKYHISRRYTTEWGYNYWLYATYAVWGFDFLFRILRVARNRWLGVSTHATVELADSEEKVLRISYLAKYHQKQRNVDNYYFLYFPLVAPYFTSHPFTLSGWTLTEPAFRTDEKSEPESGKLLESGETSESGEILESGTLASNSSRSTSPELVFYAKVCRGTTAALYRRLEKNNFQPIKLFSLLEGPYGSYEGHTLARYDVLLVLTGGIGRTVALNFLHFYIQYSSDHPASHVSKMVLMNTDRVSSVLDTFSARVETMRAQYPDIMEDVELTLHDSSSGKRVDVEKYLMGQIAKIRSRYTHANVKVGVVSCGPAKFLDETRRTVTELQDQLANGITVDLISASFAW